MFANILIVDDDVEIRKMLLQILNDEGYSVEAVERGKQALKMCKKGPFDVALVDINLPDIEGVELIKKLKHIQPNMIRVIITGHPSVDNAVKAVNEKADAYVIKPINPVELLEKIRTLIKEKETELFQCFRLVEDAKKSTPIFKYQRPEKW